MPIVRAGFVVLLAALLAGGTAHVVLAQDGAGGGASDAPEGIAPLPVDLFTTENFYLDRDYWTDPRYTRCNTPRQLTDMWTQNRVGEWGDCDVDLDPSLIVSPHPYRTAREHYDALLGEAIAAGGPTLHTRETVPAWDGRYNRGGSAGGGGRGGRGLGRGGPGGPGGSPQWIYGRNLQTATMISLLTPRYQTWMTQMNYHEAVNNAPQWNASFCYPEGLMRWWAQFSLRDIEVLVTPAQVQLLSGVADNFLRKIHIGQEHVEQVPQWYGETVGFWNGDTLVAWTANVQGWTLSHSMFEFSNSLEIVEVFRPDADGGGLTVEATFYDGEAFTGPLHTVTPWNRASGLDSTARYTFVECRVQSTIVNGSDGRPTQLMFFDDDYIDYYGRPWAQNWEEHFEQGWEKPEN
jgi:hypothetical protein